MAVYENLPAYKAAYDLLLDVYKMNVNLTREYRHTLGENLRNALADLIVTIYKANSDESAKLTNLGHAREYVVMVKLYMRMLHDLNQIKLKPFVALSEKTENLSKQITAWYNATAKKERAEREKSVQNQPGVIVGPKSLQ